MVQKCANKGSLRPRLGSLVVLLALSAGAANAADFNLRSLVPNLSNMLQGKKTEWDCDPLKEWLDAGPVGTDSGRQALDEQNRAVVLLLEDKRFKLGFGKTYAQMTQEELISINRDLLPICFNPQKGPLTGKYMAVRGVVYSVLTPQRQAANLQTLQNYQSAIASVEAMTTELGALQANETDYARLPAIRQTADGLAKTAGTAAMAPLNKAYADAQVRVADPVQAAQVNAAIGSASGYEGLAQLSALATELKRRGGGPGQQDSQNKLGERMAQIGAELAVVERGRIDVLGSGIVGMERGVQWLADFDKRFRPYIQVRPIADVQRYFYEQRGAILVAASAEFGKAVKRTTTDEQLNALQKRYLLPADANTVPGTQMQSVIAEQVRENEKRAVLGSSLDEERRETAAAKGATPGAAPKAQVSDNSVNGEPSQETMYELVRDRYEREAQRAAELRSNCGGGGGANMGDAALCLGVALTSAVGGDAPIKITRFEKLGCALASGKPGYYCEFDFSVTGGPTKFMGPITKSLMGNGSVGNARFLRRKDGWTMIYRAD